jgi:acyl-CoA thioesterase I
MASSRYGSQRAILNGVIALTLMATPALSDPIRIAALGDSLTQGFGLPPQDGLVPQLQRWLDAQGAQVVVVNAGVSGDTTAGGLARLDWTLTDDTDALIVALGGNDVLRGIDPTAVRTNLDAILTQAQARALPTLLVGTQAPQNFGPAYKSAFDALFPALAETHGALFHPNLLAPLLAIEDRATARRDYLQADQLHPNAAGVALIVTALGPAVLDLVSAVTPD